MTGHINKTSKKITLSHYATLQNGYDFFNAMLFDSTLPGCLITMQRKSSCCGYFSKNRFQSRKNQTSISLNQKKRGSLQVKTRNVKTSTQLEKASKRQRVKKSYSVNTAKQPGLRVRQRTVKAVAVQIQKPLSQRKWKHSGIPSLETRNKKRGRRLMIKPLKRVKVVKHIDEIALNPDVFSYQSDKDILDTLVHEMVHQWQYVYGKPSRKAYHNKQWADKMESIGLMPSDTGQPGGKRTGQRMSDYIIIGGKFDRAYNIFFKQYRGIHWQSPAPLLLKKQRRKSKVKYECPICGQKCWAKPKANFICGDCHVPMMA